MSIIITKFVRQPAGRTYRHCIAVDKWTHVRLKKLSHDSGRSIGNIVGIIVAKAVVVNGDESSKPRRTKKERRGK